MTIATSLILAAALMPQSVPSGIQLAGRPTTFDYWKAARAGVTQHAEAQA